MAAYLSIISLDSIAYFINRFIQDMFESLIKAKKTLGWRWQ